MHYTYDKDISKDNLCQGDILNKTDDLSKLIDLIHPHYARPEYTHFQVLTQSCDLVRRGRSKKLNTRYITLAAVRDFREVLHRSIERFAGDKTIKLSDDELCCSDKFKDKIKQTVETLLNNNDKNHFYLERAEEAGLENPSCTFLNLSIAIKANEHYETCLGAKILQLDQVFQSKLGWMVGNLYSRVGTPDYVPSAAKDPKEFNGIIDAMIESEVVWVSSDLFAKAKSAKKTNPNITNIDKLLTQATMQHNKERDDKRDDLVKRISKVTEMSPAQELLLKGAFSEDTQLKKILGQESP